MSRDPDGLFDRGCQRQVVTGAFAATRAEAAVCGSFVVEHEEVALVPACGVSADKCGLNLLRVILYGHEEDSFVAYRMACLIHQISGPVVARITVGAVIGLCAPWVAHLHQSSAVREFFDAEDDICVAVRDTNLALNLVVAVARRTSLNDLIGAVVLNKQVP